MEFLVEIRDGKSCELMINTLVGYVKMELKWKGKLTQSGCSDKGQRKPGSGSWMSCKRK